MHNTVIQPLENCRYICMCMNFISSPLARHFIHSMCCIPNLQSQYLTLDWCYLLALPCAPYVMLVIASANSGT